MKILQVLDGEPVWPPPAWLMRQAGRYLPEYKATRAEAGDFISLCLNPALATEVTLQPIRKFGFDAAILFSDILILPMALGQGLRFAEGEGPRLVTERLLLLSAAVQGHREFARQPPASPRPSLDVLTDREQDVLALVARGLSNAEIATKLFITLATVKTHVSRLLTKLAARDRAQLIVIAYESGFVTPA